ncbi:MAG TPA: hypothetical protein VFU37_17445, partial [Pyrinomonadaceae bacterium]|nr:hypothetical protein [Pyrinomonadaceae bacterium]
FNNLNIETQRETASALKSGTGAAAAIPVVAIAGVPMPEVVSFTIKCNYASSKSPQSSSTPAGAAPSNNVAAHN